VAEIIGIIVLGLIVGSFLNVCIIRLPKQKDNIFRESRCVKCKNKIDWYNNIPLLSYLWLGGKCKKCVINEINKNKSFLNLKRQSSNSNELCEKKTYIYKPNQSFNTLFIPLVTNL
jgi:hypothetical protein